MDNQKQPNKVKPDMEDAEPKAQEGSAETKKDASLALPDNCANCPDSSCCRYASDRFRGTVGYDD